MIRLVYAFSLLPAALTVRPKELLQFVVVVDSHQSLVMLMAKPNCAALTVTDGSARRWVDMVALHIRTLADEALAGIAVQAWLLAHIDPVPACPHSRDNCSLMILISSFMALIASMLAL